MGSQVKTPRFQDAIDKIQSNLERHISNIEGDSLDVSSSEEEEEAGTSGDALSRVLGEYPSVEGSDPVLLKGGSLGGGSCLICLCAVKRAEPIWNCTTCYDSFHLQCIQKWSRDSLSNLKAEAGKTNPLWACPKCRTDYGPKYIPAEYLCYCGKVRDPPLDPWNLPHSCGDVCRKGLKPACGHACSLLCHPGPCLPCPKVVTQSCHCKQSAPATRRCFDRLWSCNKVCNKRLPCGKHLCPLPCHAGECSPCKKTSIQLCRCKRHQEQQDCSSPEWTCKEKCSKPLTCGHHLCDVVCHEGQCGPCKLDGVRYCPCGKSSYELECTVATPTCEDTCGRELSCGSHFCVDRCHRGECGPCIQTRSKVCRCGARTKEVPCKNPFTCEIKCKMLRNCGKHSCNKKCCDGSDCLSCEQVCGKSLSCKNHKCPSVCHSGVCYPCMETKEISCNCGASKITVPCGMERTLKPPKCRKKCSKSSACAHKKVQVHSCHYGPCPPCSLICGKELKCSHSCISKCHEFVSVKVSNAKASSPWEARSRSTTQSLPCPDCPEPVVVSCLGEHDEIQLPCHAAKVSSCGRECGRRLPCGSHTCSRKCHRVKNAPDPQSSGSNCYKCELQCDRPRPADCSHPCQRTCHFGACGNCKVMIWLNCHCGINKIYISCHEWNNADGEVKGTLKSCKDQCPKLLPCGHRCSLTCHEFPCPENDCSKKVKLSCICKKVKTEKICSSLPLSERGNLECKPDCPSQQVQKEEEAPICEESIEPLVSTGVKERRSKNRRRRRSDNEPPSSSYPSKTTLLFFGPLAVALLSLIFYYIFLF